jgi:hypothetical protein
MGVGSFLGRYGYGGETSNAAWLAGVVQQVSCPNVATLPDFGNFSLSEPWGNTQPEDEGIRRTKALLEKYL